MMITTCLRNLAIKVAVLLFSGFSYGLLVADDGQQEAEANLEYRLIGPAASGRVSRVTGIPGDPLTYYAALASGGVWKSVNGGLQWAPIFDDQSISSTGSIAVSESNANVVYVGSGEANIRGNVGEGNGIYKSTDGGEKWSHVWQAEGQIGTLAIHPKKENTVFAAVLGSPFGPGSERGIYRTTDGGDTWEQVLFVDDQTGASDVAINPENPRIVYAGMWQTRRSPWNMQSGGPGSGLYVSRDAGETWQRLEKNGLPEGIWGRVGVRVAPTQPDRVYALIEAEQGGLFRSDDNGASWKQVSNSPGLTQRAWYYSTLTVDPSDADTVWFPQVRMLKTIDGGENIRSVKGGGWDYHDIWIDPQNPKRMLVGSDAGVSLSLDGGSSWTRPPLPTAQFYRISTDTSMPYRVLGSIQDWGTMAGPSNSLHSGGILFWDWHPVGGGEAGFVVADPEDPQIVYAGEYLGYFSRYDERTGAAPHVGIYPDNGSGHGAEDLRHRFQWTAPILISPHDSKVIYHASQTLQRTRDGGQSWEIISPDLTRNDVSKQGWSGGPITGDNTGVEFYSTIFAVAESPVEAGVIWVGSDDGLVHISRDDGENWEEVTPRGLPDWATVNGIEASRFDAGTAYLVADAHRLDDESPYLWKTTDYGNRWESLTDGLDDEIYLHVIREDAIQPGTLYLGTEREVMISRNAGDSWDSLQLNMPTVAIADLAVTENDLVVGTIGRSAWILDDLNPIRQMSADIKAQPAHLFPPVPAVRWVYTRAPNEYTEGAASNPPRGASITYYLAEVSDSEVTLEILDAEGNLVRNLTSKLKPPYTEPEHPDWSPGSKNKAELKTTSGMNRVSWDLHYNGPDRIPGARTDVGDISTGPQAAPGEYRLRLNAVGQVYEQPLTLLPDPRVQTSPANLQQQVEFQLRVRDKISMIAGYVRQLSDIKAQLKRHHSRYPENQEADELKTLGEEILDQINQIEHALYSPDAQVDYDILAGRDGGAKLLSRFGWLYYTGFDHDGPPTQGMREVEEELTRELVEQQALIQQLVTEKLVRLNSLAAQEGKSYIDIRSRQ